RAMLHRWWPGPTAHTPDPTERTMIATIPTCMLSVLLTSGLTFLPAGVATADEKQFLSHPPMRPLPTPSKRPLAAGPARYVDAAKGSDQHDGSEARPWRSVSHAVKQLHPGDTLYLRGGTYYEHVTVTNSGTADQPITIRSYPNELAILDGGLREFFKEPAQAWEPVPGGADGECRSTKTYPGPRGEAEHTKRR